MGATVTPAGTFVKDIATGLLNPDTENTYRVRVPDSPFLSEMELGVTAILKSGGAACTVNATTAVFVVPPLDPLILSV